MKPTAIIYTSNTGYTAEYAKLLGEKTGLPVCPLSDTANAPAKGASIIYLGWLMAGKVQGYQKAAERYSVCAVCGIGMGPTGSQLEDVRKANSLPADLPLFTMQGGFDFAKLRGIYKFMMTIMSKTVGKTLAGKPDRTPEEDVMLQLLTQGGSFVSEANLTAVLDWYRKEI